MHTAVGLDRRKFRDALGTFTTGVTIVTTRAGDGEPVGLTANSFNSVSLEPPMVLWSLAKTSRSLPAFDASEYWAVHILSVDQETLSNLFAKQGEDKFAGLLTQVGTGGVPLLPDCTARMQCKTAFKYEGGDHIIFVGEVIDFDHCDLVPLAFQGGKYAVASHKTSGISLSRACDSEWATGFTENFVNYLLGRAYFQFFGPIREHFRELGLSENEYYVLAVLMIKEGRTVSQMNALFSYTEHDATPEMIAKLCERGLLRVAGDPASSGCFLTDRAREVMLNILAAAKAREDDVFAKLGHGDAISLKNLLKRFIVETDPGLPDPWGD